MLNQTIFAISDDNGALPELCAGAKSLASRVIAVVFGDSSAAEAAAGCGADAIRYCPVSDEGAPEDYAAAIAAAVMLNTRVRPMRLAMRPDATIAITPKMAAINSMMRNFSAV